MFPRLIASASVLAAALLPHQLELGGGMVRRSREIGGGSRRRGGRFCGHGFHLFDDLPRSVLWVSLVAVWVVSDRGIGSSGDRFPFVLEIGKRVGAHLPVALVRNIAVGVTEKLLANCSIFCT